MNQHASDNGPEKIVLDLTKSDSAQCLYQDDNFIQKDAIKDMKLFVGNTLASIKPESKITNKHTFISRKHEAIFIHGERGCGKTTFMLSAMEHLCTLNEPVLDKGVNGDTFRHSLCSLGIIDPTIISTKENSFVLIISKIVDAVEDNFKEQAGVGVDYHYQSWRKKLQELARGLCMLDNVGTEKLKQDNWGDAHFIMQEGLEDSKSGLMLEQNFHAFVKISLELLNRKAFILGFDDIDTSFNSGWPVLEILRKYLTTPRFIILLAGDYSLYSKLVRRELWKNFEQPTLFVQHETEAHLQKTVEDLEEQYLRKILPPERRISLKGVWELEKVLWLKLPKGNDETNKVLFTEYLTAVIQLWYRFPDEFCKYIGSFFMHMPLRTVISLLQTINGDEKIRAITNAQAIKVHERKEHSDLAPIDFPEKEKESEYILNIHSRIIQTFYGQLSDLGFTRDDLHILQWTGQFNTLAKFLLQKRLLPSGASLFPINVTQQHGLDILVLAGLYYSVLVADIEHVFSYYIRVLLVQDLLCTHTNYDGVSISLTESVNITDRDIKDKLVSSSNSLEDICKYCTWIYLNQVDDNIEESERPRVLRSRGLLEIKTIECTEEEYKYLVNYCTFAWTKDGETKYYFSVYNLFALLGLCIGDNGHLKTELEKHNLITQLQPEFYRTAKVVNGAITDKEGNAKAPAPKGNDTPCQEWQKFTKENRAYAAQFHNLDEGKDTRASRTLPPYKHAKAWSELYEFCASEISLDLKKILEKYLKSMSEPDPDKDSYAPYIRNSPFAKLILSDTCIKFTIAGPPLLRKMGRNSYPRRLITPKRGTNRVLRK